MKRIVLVALILACPLMAHAQQTDTSSKKSSAAADSAFARARRMVLGGSGPQGRALIDSMVSAATPGTAEYAQALFWHASLAATAADAERDYRRIIVDYPLSPRAGDALYALAQLESSRGDRTAAIEHLQRLQVEHPDFPERSRAGLILGRLMMETGEVPRGCAVLERTRAGVPETRVELRNQIDYYAQRCAGVDTSEAAAAAAKAAADSAAARAKADSARKAEAAARGPQFTVQVAAYNTKAQAQRLEKRLKARGFEARIVGTAKPYRVRVGRYDKRTDAAAAVRRMKAKGISGFVTEAEPQGEGR